MRSGNKQLFFLILALFLNTSLLMINQAKADSVSVLEAQKDKVKCINSKDCYQVTTANYKATVKLSAKTVAPILEAVLQGSADEINASPLQFAMGAFSFSGTLSSVNKGKAKVTKSGLEGTWIQSHSVCSKYDPSGQVCKKTKTIIDGSVKIKLNTKTGGTLVLIGQSADEHGQMIYSNICRENPLSQFTDNATITIGQQTATAPLNINCKILHSTKNIGNNAYSLVNVLIKALLPPATFFVQTIIHLFDEFFLAPKPIGYTDQSGFNDFGNRQNGFVSLSKMESYRKSEAESITSDIAFIYYITSSKIHLANPSQFKDNVGDAFPLDWKTYPADAVFFPVSSTRSYYDSNGSILYYGLSEEEFDAVKSSDSISLIINHSLKNVLNYQTSTDFSFDYWQNDKTDRIQIFGVSHSKGRALIKIAPDTSIYSLRMQVKQGH